MSVQKSIETVGSFEAKTHLAQLLRKVESGLTIRISQHGRPIADLVPIPKGDASSTSQAAALMKEFQANAAPLKKGVTIKSLIEYGRK